MTERIHVPSGTLAPFVQFLWFSDGYRPVGSRERVLPSGYSQLVFNLDGVPFRDYEGWCRTRPRALGEALVSGVRARYAVIDSTRRHTTMGALLRPGAIWALLRVPASALGGDTFNLDDLFRTDTQAWIQRLSEADTVDRKLRLLESLLRDRLDPAIQTSPAVVAAVEAWESPHRRISVADMIERSGYSRRRFLDLFKEAVGVAPKTYVRLRRFQRALAHVGGMPVEDWSGLALDCGYYDQAHLIQEFRQFAGVTPVTYSRAHPSERNHLAL